MLSSSKLNCALIEESVTVLSLVERSRLGSMPVYNREEKWAGKCLGETDSTDSGTNKKIKQKTNEIK